MKILHINDTDLTGARFNGHDLQVSLNELGHEAYQFVFGKEGNDPNTICFAPKAEDHMIREHCRLYESSLSIHALVYPFGKKIIDHSVFMSTDIVHCHLIHNHIMSIYDFEEITKRKPTVWTLHDPWAFTGHCVHPRDCTEWKTGCASCEHLDRYFPLKNDKSHLMWRIKKQVYENLNIDIVVASLWMKQFVEESPLTSHLQNVHLIPFGVDLSIFNSKHNKLEIRKKLGIGPEDFVLFFRADLSEFKGLSAIKEMLSIIQPTKPVTLLTVAQTGLMNHHKFNVIDMGWVKDPYALAELYCACDVFLMPSTAESFGLMAIEAMASSRPVIIQEGTALQSITYVPECGVSFQRNDIIGFKEAVERLMNNPEECNYRGEKGREIAEKNYSFEDYVKRHIKLYEEILSRKT